MKESLKKFREEAEKLEQSEALKAARQKFETVEKEASKGSEVFKEKFSTIKEKVQGVIDEAGKTEIVKKAGKISEEIGKTTHTISEKAQEISKTGAFQSISEATRAVKQEIDTTSMQGRVYVSPPKLRKRTETSAVQNQKFYEANLEATGVELHKDSKFYQSWQNFKDNNPYVHKVMDWKLKYDESDNPDWCHEGPFNLFAIPIKEAYKKGYRIESKILDVDNVDLVMGKVMEQGPVLIISFTSQQMMCVKNAEGQIVEGDSDKVMRVSYVWVLCRDPTEPDPRAAWRLLDLSASSNEQLV
ncbi:hypothetical protein GEV33_012112 [Tenebrio molitor]|uniref:Tim44-like domain-containing protein n=1 Tax=Tenebrio molitor TaxID=7067 RepID=A0A8J6H9P6_TENMO|nr:hypothetical protein GEV33_012112 [Tenebrio molitor]